MATLPNRNPDGWRSLSVAGAENLYYFASKYLTDATQWWRIANLNSYPGQQPDFIVPPGANLPNPNTLLIPQPNPNAVSQVQFSTVPAIPKAAPTYIFPPTNNAATNAFRLDNSRLDGPNVLP